jgi:LysM repeat protein
LNIRRFIVAGLILVMLIAPASAALAQGGTVTHVVSPGENLYRISLRYGVSLQALRRANGLGNSNAIYSGQRLVIPTAGPTLSAAVPVVPPPNVPQDPTVQEGATIHSVARGENLYRISLRYGVNVQAMAWANGLNNPNLIYVGQKLVIPTRHDASAAPTPTPQPEATIASSATPQSTATVAPLVTPLPTPAVTQTAPAASSDTGKEIVVVLHEQKVYAYQDGQVVHSALASTGIARYPTPVGQYHIYVKYLSTLMTGPGYYLPNVPYTMYFYKGYGLHGTYWHNNFGHPMSHGCVNLPTAEARWFYEWAPVGTLVTVRQ